MSALIPRSRYRGVTSVQFKINITKIKLNFQGILKQRRLNVIYQKLLLTLIIKCFNYWWSFTRVDIWSCFPVCFWFVWWMSKYSCIPNQNRPYEAILASTFIKNWPFSRLFCDKNDKLCFGQHHSRCEFNFWWKSK